MATTVDELVVKMKADIRELETKLKKGEKVTADAVKKKQGSLSKLGDSFKNVGATIGKFHGALLAIAGAGALGALVKSSLDAADKIQDLSDNIGINTTLLQEMRFAAKMTGVEQQDLDASLMRFNRRLAEAAKGTGEFAGAYKALGISVTNTDGSLRDAEDVLFEVADKVAAVGNESEQAAILFKLFGDAGFKMVNMFKGGSDQLRGFQAEAARLGIILDKDLIQNAGDLNDKMDILSQVMKTKLSSAILEVAPILTSLTSDFIEGAVAVTKFFGSFGNNTIDEKTQELQRLEAEIARLEELAKSGGNGGILEAIFGGPDPEYIKNQIHELTIQTALLTGEINKQKGMSKEAAEAALKQEEAVKQSIAARLEMQKQAQGLVDKTGGPEAQIQKEIDLLKQARDQKIAIEGDVHAAIAERMNALTELKEQKRQEDIQRDQEELERLLERNELLAEIDAMKHADEISRNQARIDQLMAGQDQLSNYMLKKQIEQKKKEDELRAANVQAMGDFFNTSMGLAKGNSKGTFRLAKSAALAHAGVEGGVAVQRALANPPGPPYSIPQALAAGARAAANIARINGIGFAQGGIVPGSSTSGDRVPARVNSGEMILNKSQQANLFRMANGAGGGGQVVVLTGGDALMDVLLKHIEVRLVERERFGLSNRRVG